MQNPLRILFVAGVGALMVGCATDNATSPLASSQAAAALATAPISFDQLNSSFVESSDQSSGFVPMGMGFGGGRENHFGPGWGSFMGGGIGEGFIGGIGFRRGFDRGPFGDIRDSDDCAFSTTTNRVECSDETHGGLTVTRSYSFLDASGAVQQAFDAATTNTTT